MKKNEQKKLSLSRETVRSLEAVKGGLEQVSLVSSDNVLCTTTHHCPTW